MYAPFIAIEMSGSEEVPLPRYRFHHKSQRWYKEPCRYALPVEQEEKCECASAFVSSFDYFLGRGYAVQKIDDPKTRQNRKRDETNMEIERFQARNLIAGSSSINVIEKDSSDDEMPPELDLDDRETLSPISVEIQCANPLMGYVSDCPLHAIYQALVTIKKDILETGSDDEVSSIQLNFDEFYELIQAVGNGNLLSASYLQNIFRALPTYSSQNDAVEGYDFFSFIVDNAYHPALNRNVNMLFLVFGVKDGTIPLISLHSRIILAWAEMNTHGNLHSQWVKFARAVETVESYIFTERLIVRGNVFLNRSEVSALMCSHPLLWKVMNSIDMDGGAKTSRKKEVE